MSLVQSNNLTAFHIKVLAACLMVIDHVGYVLDDYGLRVVGRFAFPLFAWLLVQGAKHTQDWKRYSRRLLVLAIASQPIYVLFIHSLLPLNPVFQLWSGLLLCQLFRQYQLSWLLGIALVSTASLFFNYHYYGVGLIYLIAVYPYLLPNDTSSINTQLNRVLWIFAFIGLHFYYGRSYPLQIFALPTLVFLPFLHHVRARGRKARWFYWFYPVHLAPLILLKVLL